MNTTTSSTERSRRYRRRLADNGGARMTIAVDRKTAERLRNLARDHQQTVGAVLQLASLLAERALAEPTTFAAE